MSDIPPLPENVERLISSVHMEGCACEMWGEPEKGSSCYELKEEVRRAVAAAVENAKADSLQIVIDGLSLSGKQANMIATLRTFVEAHRRKAAAIEAGGGEK